MKLLNKSIAAYFSNWTTTIPATFVIAIMLTFFHVLVLVHSGARQLVTSLESKVSLTYYLKESADPFEVSSLIKELESEKTIIEKVTYTSPQDALALLDQAFSLDTELIKKYNVQLPASIVITPLSVNFIDSIDALVTEKSKLLLHPTKNNDTSSSRATNDLKNFLLDLEQATTRVLSFFLVIFGVGSILLISSTIHLSLAHRSNEVTIMHFVGAKESTITTPYIIEGMLLGIFAFAVNLVFVALLPFGEFNSTVAQNALIAELILSVAITTLTSYLTTARHLSK